MKSSSRILEPGIKPQVGSAPESGVPSREAVSFGVALPSWLSEGSPLNCQLPLGCTWPEPYPWSSSSPRLSSLFEMHFTSSNHELRRGPVSGHNEPKCHTLQYSYQRGKVWGHMLRKGLEVKETEKSERWPILRRKEEKEQEIKMRLWKRRWRIGGHRVNHSVLRGAWETVQVLDWEHPGAVFRPEKLKQNKTKQNSPESMRSFVFFQIFCKWWASSLLIANFYVLSN